MIRVMQRGKKYLLSVLLAALAIVLAVSGVGAVTAPPAYLPAAGGDPALVTVDLWAETGTLTLPDTTVVPVWGLATSNGGAAMVPGPVIEATEGDTVTVTLTNHLAENVSLIFTGQDLLPDYVGAAPGGTVIYSFTAGTPGTYLYEAGVNPERQVPMGLYGALVVRPALGAGYAYNDATTAFDTEAVLVFSEIDPNLNADPAGFNLLDFSPTYFLINGAGFPDTAPVLALAGDTVLFRYLNAGVVNHSMELLGLYQTVIAHDGNPLNFSFETFSQLVSAGETMDLLSTVPGGAAAGTRYPLFVRNRTMHLYAGSVYPGGMLTFLTVDGPVTDIAVTGVSAPSPVVEGASVSVDVTVANIGNQDVGTDIGVSLSSDLDGAIGGGTIVGGLTAGSSTVVNVVWDTTGATVSSHTLTATQGTADDNAANDTNGTFVTVNAAVTDLAVTAFSATANVTQGANVSANVTVANIGNQNVSADITVNLTSNWDGLLASANITGGLLAGNSTIVNFNWDTTGATLGDHTLTAAQQTADDNAANDAQSANVTVNAP